MHTMPRRQSKPPLQVRLLHPTELAMLKEVLNANELSVDGSTDQEFGQG